LRRNSTLRASRFYDDAVNQNTKTRKDNGADQYVLSSGNSPIFRTGHGQRNSVFPGMPKPQLGGQWADQSE